NLAQQNIEKEIKWHLAAIIPRLKLGLSEKKRVYDLLFKWLNDSKESKIVRVNSFQSLFNFARDDEDLYRRLGHVIEEIKKEKISSLNARIKSVWPAANPG